MTRTVERPRLGCWFESLAVASRPLQRRPRRNDLGSNHPACKIQKESTKWTKFASDPAAAGVFALSKEFESV